MPTRDTFYERYQRLSRFGLSESKHVERSGTIRLFLLLVLLAAVAPFVAAAL